MAPQNPLCPSTRPSSWGPERILFEDDWLILADKPAGLPSQPTLDPSRASAVSELKAYLHARDGREPYLVLHHRLDRDTSGVLLFTKDPKANAAAGALFSEKTAQKIYQALSKLNSDIEPSWEMKNYLGLVGRVGKANKYGAVRSNGDPAHTSFRLLERYEGAALIEAQPHTGRTHQIRVHLAANGKPILGDEFYGGPMTLRLSVGASLRFPRVLLHASSLRFRHPITEAELTISSPLPADFADCVQQLRNHPR